MLDVARLPYALFGLHVIFFLLLFLTFIGVAFTVLLQFAERVSYGVHYIPSVWILFDPGKFNSIPFQVIIIIIINGFWNFLNNYFTIAV